MNKPLVGICVAAAIYAAYSVYENKVEEPKKTVSTAIINIPAESSSYSTGTYVTHKMYDLFGEMGGANHCDVNFNREEVFVESKYDPNAASFPGVYTFNNPVDSLTQKQKEGLETLVKSANGVKKAAIIKNDDGKIEHIVVYVY